MIDAPGVARERCPWPRFTPPELSPHFVWRSRLGNPILEGLSQPLVLVKAPAGYGKSALLASVAALWNRQDRGTTDLLAWYSLSAADDDPAVFLDGIIEAVRRGVPDFGRTARAALRGQRDARSQLSPLMGLVRDELSQLDRRVQLVLDDFHHLRDTAILTLVEKTIWDDSAPLRFVLSTEEEPRVYLSPLRARGQMVEIDASALRLSTEEVHELLSRRAGSAVSPNVVASVDRQTEGWASAVNLSSVLVARDRVPLPFSRFAPTEYGYRRLVQEFLSNLDPATRDLVVKSAFLPDLEPDTMGRILAVGQPHGLADWLAGVGLPVSRPAGYTGPVRYEPLFQSTLRAEAERAMAPSDLVALRCSLAELLSERGDWEDAARFYLEAGRLEEAASAAERGVERALEMGYLDSALRIARALPNGARASHPVLKVHEARPLIIRNQVDEARALLVSVRPELEALDDHRGLGMQLTRWVSLLLAEGRYEDAEKLARQGLDQLPEGSSEDRSDLLLLLSRALEHRGELAEAYASASEALWLAQSRGRRHLAVSCLRQLSWIARLRGQLALSIALAGRAVYWSQLYEGSLLTGATLGGGVAICHMELGLVSQGLTIARESLEAGRRIRDAEAQMEAYLALALGHDLSGDGAASEESLAAAMGIAESLPAGHLGRVEAYQMSATLMRSRGDTHRARQDAARALAAARGASHQPLVDQCQASGLAKAARGVDDRPTLAHPPRSPWPAGGWERAAEEAELSLHTLGEFLPLVQGDKVAWASDDARLLGAYLLVHRGEAKAREQLLAEVWPGVEPDQSNLRLEAALYTLRESLGTGYPLVDREMEERNQLRWDGASIEVDADLLMERTGDAAGLLGAKHPRVLPAEVVGLLESAITHYHGEFLSGISHPWCVPGRVVLRGRLLWAAGLLVDHYLGMRDWGMAVRHGLVALKSDPLDETMVQRLMISYARLGDRTAVLLQYQGVKRALAKARGEWPSEETRRLRVKLLGR